MQSTITKKEIERTLAEAEAIERSALIVEKIMKYLVWPMLKIVEYLRRPAKPMQGKNKRHNGYTRYNNTEEKIPQGGILMTEDDDSWRYDPWTDDYTIPVERIDGRKVDI